MKRIAILILLLSGCATQQDRIIAWADDCAAYGYARGTAEHAQCVQYLAQQRQAKLNAVSAMYSTMGAQMLMAPTQGAPVQQQTNCYRTYSGYNCTRF